MDGTAKKSGWRGAMRIAVLLSPIALALAVAAVYAVNPARAAVPLCLVHAFTGLHCPGCGMTRALHALLHGDVALALRSNALLFVALPLLAYLFAAEWFKALRRKAVLPTGNVPKALWVSVLALALVFCVLRNLPVEPFIWWVPPV